MIVCDIDGSLTDGAIYITEKGDQFRKFHVRDGMAFAILKRNGFKTAILSHAKSIEIVKVRAEMLKADFCYVGTEDKLAILYNCIEELGWHRENICFLGDDVNDIEVLRNVGCGICPSNAVGQAKEVADIVLKTEGGNGTLREFVDEYLKIEY